MRLFSGSINFAQRNSGLRFDWSPCVVTVPPAQASHDMNWRRIIAVGFALAGLSVPAEHSARAAEFAWQEVSSGRSAGLTVPAEGRTGFTLVLPEHSGIAFTNSLDEVAAAANR